MSVLVNHAAFMPAIYSCPRAEIVANDASETEYEHDACDSTRAGGLPKRVKGNDASKTVDGDDSTGIKLDTSECSSPDPQIWWAVDFERSQDIAWIAITIRGGERDDKGKTSHSIHDCKQMSVRLYLYIVLEIYLFIVIGSSQIVMAALFNLDIF